MKSCLLLMALLLAVPACGKKEGGPVEPVVETTSAPVVEEQPAVEAEVPTPADEAEQQLKAWERLDTPVKAEQYVAWTEAADYLNKVVGVEGTIVDTYNSGRACFLNFTKEWQGEFYLAILGSNLNAFDQAPEKKFLSKKVRVVGKVKMYKGRPQIVVETPQHIQIVE